MINTPTSYADVNVVIDLLLTGMHTILNEKLVGLYLFGSLVTGDFDEDVSDIDLLAAISSEMNEQEFAALQAMHHDVVTRHTQWDNRIEIAYLSVHALQTFKFQRSPIAIISPGEPFHIKEAGKDWLINWYVVREDGVTLFGPPPEAVIAPLSKEEFLRAVHLQMQAWREWSKNVSRHPRSQAYITLTMCRGLYTCATRGEEVSKKRAALWAMQAFPQWATLLQNALVWRKAQDDKDAIYEATLPETLRFVDFAIRWCENAPLV